MSKKLIFTIGEKVVKFTVGEFEDIDIDKILKIDYGNLMAELITFPVVVNRLGLLAADMDNEKQQAKLNLDIYEAKRKNELREELQTYDEKGKARRAPSVDEVESALMIDVKWQAKKKKLLRIDKEKEYMYSVYMSAKDKSNKLDKLSMTLRPGDIDEQLIQKQMNKIHFQINEGRLK